MTWTKSRWKQAGIAFVVALIASACVFIYTNNTHFRLYAQQYPHDGQDGLSAFMDAFAAGGGTLAGVFVGLIILQRLLAPASKTAS